MIDTELKKHLDSIEKELTGIRKNINSLSSSFIRGIFYGAGTVIGAALIIVIIGWILNIVGVIPALNDRVIEFRDALNHINTPIK